MKTPVDPSLSVVIPTYNNVDVLARCLDSWQSCAGDESVELIVIDDGCRDGTPDLIARVAHTEWGRTHLRWHRAADQHELRCTNSGMRRARAPLVMAWQDDMFVRARWLVPEIVATFAAYDDLGLLCLSRGLNCHPLDEQVETWEDLFDSRRLESTIGPRPLNWCRLQEVDGAIRPWVVRRACTDAVGLLDEAFVPTEWDEIDLCFRVRQAGWRVATHGYERLGAYHHLGSTTIGVPSSQYKQRVLRNGRLFHQRWDDAVRAAALRPRRTWWRKASASGWMWTAGQVARAAVARGVRR
jgi:glycosyltransferase involved in cell wall biosynthesis